MKLSDNIAPALKGAFVGLAGSASLLFAGGLFVWGQGEPPQPENDYFFQVLITRTLCISVGLGAMLGLVAAWLRRRRIPKLIAINLLCVPAVIGGWMLAVGSSISLQLVWMSLAWAVILGPFLMPVAALCGVAIAVWVRPRGVE